MGIKAEDNSDKIQISEMFMAQASDDECFYGILTRSQDSDGNPHLFSRIVINDGLIMASASDQETLGKMLDELSFMVLHMGLHDDSGNFIEIFREKYFMN